MQQDPKIPGTEVSNDKVDEETAQSIEDGRKAIAVEKEVGDKSEEEQKEDAERFRNEG